MNTIENKKVAEQDNDTSCGPSCGCGTATEEVSNPPSYEDYQEEHGACGCGSGCGCGPEENTTDSSLPVQYRILRKGDRVVEFSSKKGIDSLSASHFIGQGGKVVGIAESDEDLQTAWQNMDQLDVTNVEFRKGELTNIPLSNDYAHVVLGNRIINPASDKQKVVDEAYRVCNHDGVVCITELVYFNPLPEAVRKQAESFAVNVQGIEKIETFLSYFDKTGFSNTQVVELKKMMLPEDSMSSVLSGSELENIMDPNSYEGIFSVCVVAEKPHSCAPETCCQNPDKHKN